MPDSDHITPEEVARCAQAIEEKKYDQLPLQLREHLSHCDQCAAEVLMVSELSSDIHPFGKEKSKRFPSARTWIPILVAAVVIAFIFLLIPERNPDIQNDTLVQSDVSNSNQTIPPSPVIEDKVVPEIILQEQAGISNSDTAQMIDQEEVAQPLLASFTPDQELEKLFENFQGAYRTQQITIKSTGIILYAEQDSLIWENEAAKNVGIEIFNNTGELVYSQNTNSWALPLPELSPGLHYWKLIEQEDFDLLYVGKIIKE